MRKEIWCVDIRDGHDPYHYKHLYYVAANNAAQAEKHALKVARSAKGGFNRTDLLSVYRAEFLCNAEV